MSSHVVYTCDGCGAEAEAGVLNTWRRVDIEVFHINVGGKDKVANLDLCAECVKKHVSRFPGLHKAVK